MEKAQQRYRSVVHDNARFEGFTFREDDIIISTPAKCGTTWTQTIVAFLVFQTSDLHRPLDLISPWLEQSLRPLDDVVADLEAQEHRRFIKSHTPLDGLPYDERVTYIAVARDPRDVALSWDNHLSNIDFAAFLSLREKAVGLEDLAELMPDGPPVPPESELERFWVWVYENPTIGGSGVSGLDMTLRHLYTFWQARNRPNVVLLHYGDLKADLEGQMRALAKRLSMEVPEEKWPALVKAATFDEMKAKATERGPNQTESIWLDAQRFFHKGTSGQWQRLLDDDALKRYEARVNELTDDREFSAWVHQGPIVG